MNSASPNPRVASAGVPIRRPEVTIGGRGSNGHRVAVDGDADLVEQIFALLAVELTVAQVDEHQVDIGATGQYRYPGLGDVVAVSRSARMRAPSSVRCWRSLNSSEPAIFSATALAAITCMSGPPC